MAMSLPPSALQLAPAPGTPNTPALNILEKLAPGGFPQDSKDRLNKLFDPLEQKKRKTESGQLDLQQQQTALQSDQLSQLMSGAGIPAGDPADPSWKLMFDQLKTGGRAKNAFNEAGQPRSNAELRAELDNLPEGGGEFDRMVATDQEARVEELANLQQTQAQVKQALQVVSDPASPNIVGPGAGSWLVQKLRRVQAAVGAGEAAFEEQRALERLQSGLVLGRTAMLKGPLSEKELAFLQQSVPTLEDTEKTWENYLKEYSAIVERKVDAKQANLEAAPGAKMPGSVKSDSPPAAPAETQEPVAVTTAQEILALPAGTPYKTPGGRIVIRGQE
jgi:hypothetical protein